MDVLVIGGGPSGLMAAIGAAEHGAKVTLLDKGNKLGRKLAISGGGRCNVTNRLPLDEIVKHIPGNGRFLYSAFSVFHNEDIIAFFEALGVGLKEEDHGRMFPVSNSAQDVVQALLRRLAELKVTIRTNTPVDSVAFTDEHVHSVTLQNGEVLKPKAVIIAVGGASVPHTGSTGDGYAWAEAAGHTITDLFPTEVPLTSQETFIKERTLQGISLRGARVSVLHPKKKKTLVTHEMDMLFTHFGLSGPAILRCSQYVVKAKMQTGSKTVPVVIDALPSVTPQTIEQQLFHSIKEAPKRAMKNNMQLDLPERYVLFLLEKSGIDVDAPSGTISHDKLRVFAGLLKEFPVEVNGTLPMEKAFVTGGGVSIKEIVPKTMASKKKAGLYFSGEILDIHGYTGGYNITSALVTGRVAGMNAAAYCQEQATLHSES
ncbi:BaiN/RdsA family NAD(P)/FAD-dependent oxidoreductase [Bacillus fonticola]|uniref:NAD(P)/FAD-dependent oxidoreductase n=1 Tax=Bacillus fonticola TaxID=2728853 RepID=UPI00147304FD|nr:NAD(P)/FAD-dependent oxidoreductase [Bacillus fonticola]